MVEAKIRVELTMLSKVENPFYGKTTTKKVIEESYYHDKDERNNIAPFGINATIAIEHHYDHCDEDGVDVFDIRLNKYYFEEDVLPNTYHTFFNIDGKTYELSMSVVNEQVKNLALFEWASVGDFEDGDKPLFCYCKDEFTSYQKMYL